MQQNHRILNLAILLIINWCRQLVMHFTGSACTELVKQVKTLKSLNLVYC